MLDRAEGVAVVLIGIVVMGLVRRVPVKMATIAMVAICLVPAGWAVRNQLQIGRFELTDPMSAYVNAVLSVTDGNFSGPLYQQGVRLAEEGGGTHPHQRERAAAADRHEIASQLSHNTLHVLAYKAKCLANFPFIPLVWSWSAGGDYGLSQAAAHLNSRNILRLVWSVLLFCSYVLAVVGLVAWLRRGKWDWVAGVLLYPVLAFLVAVPFPSELRVWFAAAAILIVPSVAGGIEVIDRLRGRRRPIAVRRAPSSRQSASIPAQSVTRHPLRNGTGSQTGRGGGASPRRRMSLRLPHDRFAQARADLRRNGTDQLARRLTSFAGALYIRVGLETNEPDFT